MGYMGQERDVLDRMITLLLLMVTSLALVGSVVGKAECRKKCGDAKPDIRYPFGIDRGCGDPLHPLTCDDNDLTVFNNKSLPNLPNVTVINIDYDKKTLTLNTTSFMQAVFSAANEPPPDCKLPVQLNINDSPAYDTHRDLVVLCLLGDNLPESDFNTTIILPHCRFDKFKEVPYRGLTCYGYNKTDLDDSSDNSGYDGGVATNNLGPPIKTWPWVSYAEVPWSIVPSSGTEGICEDCDKGKDGGTCGYDVNSPGVFLCFCDSSNLTASQVGSGQTCTGSRKKSKSNTAAIGGAVGGGVAAVALALVVCAVCIRKKQIRKREFIAGQGGSSNSQFLTGYSSNNNTSSNYSYSSVSGSSTRFTLHELQEATNDFSEAGRLGDGGFGTVYKGQLKDGRVVAVKKLNPWNSQGKSQFDNEVTILSQVKHPHLVQLYGCCLEGRELLLVYEFVANGTLSDHLHGGSLDSSIVAINCSFLDWETRLTIVTQTAEALSFLHTQVNPPIYHRDVKSTNILVDERFHAKVGDFGLSRLVPSLELTHVTTAPQGTPGYLDPDYHQSYQLTDKSDVYSLGVVLMEIVSAQRAVDMSRGRKEINLAAMAVARIQENRTEEILDSRLGCDKDAQLRSLVKRVAELGFQCLAPEKDDRPCMREVFGQLQEVLAETRKMHPSRSHSLAREVDVLSSSPTTVQVKWSSHSTSPNDSSDSIL